MMSPPSDVFSCVDAARALFSYVDPVSGVILLQLLVGGCIGYFAFTARKIGRFFVRFFHRGTASAGEDLPCEVAVSLEQPTAVVEQKAGERPPYRRAA